MKYHSLTEEQMRVYKCFGLSPNWERWDKVNREYLKEKATEIHIRSNELDRGIDFVKSLLDLTEESLAYKIDSLFLRANQPTGEKIAQVAKDYFKQHPEELKEG